MCSWFLVVRSTGNRSNLGFRFEPDRRVTFILQVTPLMERVNLVKTTLLLHPNCKPNVSGKLRKGGANTHARTHTHTCRHACLQPNHYAAVPVHISSSLSPTPPVGVTRSKIWFPPHNSSCNVIPPLLNCQDNLYQRRGESPWVTERLLLCQAFGKKQEGNAAQSSLKKAEANCLKNLSCIWVSVA